MKPNILFIMTANSLDTIPSALLDRFEVLRLSGYIEEEKMQIAKKYLLKKNREKVGLKSTDFTLKADALHKIINGYCREAEYKRTNSTFVIRNQRWPSVVLTVSSWAGALEVSSDPENADSSWMATELPSGKGQHPGILLSTLSRPELCGKQRQPL